MTAISDDDCVWCSSDEENCGGMSGDQQANGFQTSARCEAAFSGPQEYAMYDTVSENLFACQKIFPLVEAEDFQRRESVRREKDLLCNDFAPRGRNWVFPPSWFGKQSIADQMAAERKALRIQAERLAELDLSLVRLELSLAHHLGRIEGNLHTDSFCTFPVDDVASAPPIDFNQDEPMRGQSDRPPSTLDRLFSQTSRARRKVLSPKFALLVCWLGLGLPFASAAGLGQGVNLGQGHNNLLPARTSGAAITTAGVSTVITARIPQLLGAIMCGTAVTWTLFSNSIQVDSTWKVSIFSTWALSTAIYAAIKAIKKSLTVGMMLLACATALSVVGFTQLGEKDGVTFLPASLSFSILGVEYVCHEGVRSLGAAAVAVAHWARAPARPNDVELGMHPFQ